jgi:tetratricopeptide (TPR) repeat protein
MVLLDPMMNGPWFSQMRSDSGWRLLYFDPGTALYARSGYATQIAPTTWEDTLKRWGLDPPPPDSIVTDLAKVHRSALADWIEGFWSPQDYPMDLFRLGAFAYAHGRLDLARSFWVEALRRTQGRYYEIFFNLGAAYEHGGAKDLARTCYQKVLDLDPGNAKAEAKLRQL